MVSKIKKIFILIAIAILLSISVTISFFERSINTSADNLLLLVPVINSDAYTLSLIKAWQNVAAEEGLHLVVMDDDDFSKLSKIEYSSYAGLILPDTIHKNMSSVMASHIISYVKSGGDLMLVYDAGLLNLAGFYSAQSPFSTMVGMNYGLYNKLKNNMIGKTAVGQDKNILDMIGIPPGKTTPQNSTDVTDKNFRVIAGYQYGGLQYPFFIASDVQDKTALLTTPDKQFIAGVRSYGKGHVLFVNLPLSYLMYWTDSMLAHVFLHYFAVNMLHLPVLSQTPYGIGGLVLNIHVESNASLPAFKILYENGVFNQGPYSIDITAGPDLVKVGDNLGLNVQNNALTKKWINFFLRSGDEIGSDGGWMHDYFGEHVNETNKSQFENYLTLNIQALEQATQRKMLEYTPSMGAQPTWVIRYLEEHGFVGYYTMSNTGTCPSKGFRDGVFDADNIWSFPLLPYGKYATFEEFNEAKIPVSEITQWLLDSANFTVAQHTVRLVYFHPPGVINYNNLVAGGVSYLSSIKQLFVLTKKLNAQKQFQWYTMVDIAKFMDLRKQVNWKVVYKGNEQIITATHPVSLNSITWLIAKNSCNLPQIKMGVGKIQQDATNWIVTAGNVRDFTFDCEKIGMEAY